LVDHAVVEKIGVGVVAVDFEDFRDIAASRPAIDLNHDMEGVADIALDGAVGQLDAALEDTAREPGETLSGRVGVNGGQCPRVTRIEKLQKIKRLAAANLPELRDGYACGWCELKDGQLILVPHITSPQPIRRFSHLDEAEIIGRVTGVAMRIVGGGLSALSELPLGGHGKA
jgi:hypothetical protein